MKREIRGYEFNFEYGTMVIEVTKEGQKVDSFKIEKGAINGRTDFENQCFGYMENITPPYYEVRCTGRTGVCTRDFSVLDVKKIIELAKHKERKRRMYIESIHLVSSLSLMTIKEFKVWQEVNKFRGY